MKDLVIEAVREDLLRRSEVGIAKYGRPLSARNDLGLRDWLQHAYEETLDQANYLKCAILELDKRPVLIEQSDVRSIPRFRALENVVRQLEMQDYAEVDLDVEIRIKDEVRTITVKRR